jgi:hypothetical protein
MYLTISHLSIMAFSSALRLINKFNATNAFSTNGFHFIEAINTTGPPQQKNIVIFDSKNVLINGNKDSPSIIFDREIVNDLSIAERFYLKLVRERSIFGQYQLQLVHDVSKLRESYLPIHSVDYISSFAGNKVESAPFHMETQKYENFTLLDIVRMITKEYQQ